MAAVAYASLVGEPDSPKSPVVVRSVPQNPLISERHHRSLAPRPIPTLSYTSRLRQSIEGHGAVEKQFDLFRLAATPIQTNADQKKFIVVYPCEPQDNVSKFLSEELLIIGELKESYHLYLPPRLVATIKEIAGTVFREKPSDDLTPWEKECRYGAITSGMDHIIKQHYEANLQKKADECWCIVS